MRMVLFAPERRSAPKGAAPSFLTEPSQNDNEERTAPVGGSRLRGGNPHAPPSRDQEKQLKLLLLPWRQRAVVVERDADDLADGSVEPAPAADRSVARRGERPGAGERRRPDGGAQ